MGTAPEIRWRFNVFQFSLSVSSSEIFRVFFEIIDNVN